MPITPTIQAAEMGRNTAPGQLGQKARDLISISKQGVVTCLSVVPVMWEAQVGGSPGKNVRPYLKNKQSKTGLVVWLKLYSSDLTSMRN
jgi:hypothetical protein